MSFGTIKHYITITLTHNVEIKKVKFYFKKRKKNCKKMTEIKNGKNDKKVKNGENEKMGKMRKCLFLSFLCELNKGKNGKMRKKE